MPSINKVILVGRLGQDPRKRDTRDGKEYSTFSIATSKKVREEEKTVWHNIVVWNEHTAKYVNDYARTGALVYVEGEIEQRSYEKDGQTHYAIDIVVGAYEGKVQILADAPPRDRAGEPAKPATPPRRQVRAEPPKPAPDYEQDLNDEIPF